MAQEITFHKLTNQMLSTFSQIYDGIDDESEQLLNDLKKAKGGSLDDYTLNRVKNQYTERLVYLDAGEKQFHKWLAEEKPNNQQEIDIKRFLKIIDRTRVITNQILDLCKNLESQTIESVLGKSDFEIGLNFLKNFN